MAEEGRWSAASPGGVIRERLLQDLCSRPIRAFDRGYYAGGQRRNPWNSPNDSHAPPHLYRLGGGIIVLLRGVCFVLYPFVYFCL